MKLGADELEYIRYIEDQTKAQVKDCLIYPNEIVFVVREGDMGLAIGKGGEAIARIREKIGRNISLVEYSDDPKRFLRNLFAPAKLDSIEIDNGKATVKSQEYRRLIGKNEKRIKRAKELMSRHYNIEDIVITEN